MGKRRRTKKLRPRFDKKIAGSVKEERDLQKKETKSSLTQDKE